MLVYYSYMKWTAIEKSDMIFSGGGQRYGWNIIENINTSLRLKDDEKFGLLIDYPQASLSHLQ